MTLKRIQKELQLIKENTDYHPLEAVCSAQASRFFAQKWPSSRQQIPHKSNEVSSSSIQASFVRHDWFVLSLRNVIVELFLLHVPVSAVVPFKCHCAFLESRCVSFKCL